MNIVYASDDNYAFLAGVSMESLFINNKSVDIIDVYILDDGISDVNKDKLETISQRYGRNIIFIDIRSFSDEIRKHTSVGFNYEGKMSFTTYARFFIDDVLPASVDRALYIDCDTLIVAGIEEAYNVSLSDDCVISMAVDCTQREYVKSLDMKQDNNYYNAGVTLFDIARWRDKKCRQRIISHMQNVRSDYPLPDQDLLNVVLGDEIYKLPLKYNVQSPNYMYKTYASICSAYSLDERHYYDRNAWEEAMNNPAIIHFSGASFIRPWYHNSNHPLKRLYLDYYEPNVFYSKDDYNNSYFNANSSVKIRYIMYKVLNPYINGIISGYCLKKWIQKQYLGNDSVWKRTRDDN